jgi:hypothetical protein
MAKATTLFQVPRISIGVGLALTVLTVLITAAYIWVPEPYHGAVIVFGTGMAASGAIASAIYMGRTLAIYIARETQSPQEAAFRFAERWNDPQMFHVRDACREIMDMMDQPDAERRRRFDEEEALRKNIRPVLNFLEELSYSIREERADEATSKRLFAGIVINVYHVTEPWIREQRQRRNRPQLWAELGWLYQEWSAG